MQQAIESENPEHRYAQGRQYKAKNDWVAAEREYREALRLRPDFCDVWISLGILLRALKRLSEAEDCQREALRADSANAVATLNLGNVLYDQERFEAAAECFRHALEMNPTLAEAHNNLGRILLRSGEAGAAKHFIEALKIKADYFEAAEGLGNSLFWTGHYEEAAAAFAAAVHIRPDAVTVHLSMANACLGARRFDAAQAEYELLLRAVPNMAKAKAGLATVLAAKGQYTKPRALYQEALAASPDDSWIRGHYGLLLLRSCQFDIAWDYYEYRWQTEQFKDAMQRALPQPKWQGEPLHDKTLLLIAEQGLGDEIMFASMFHEIIRETGHCIVECDERLSELFRRSFPSATIFGVNRHEREWHRVLQQNLDRLPPFHYWTSAGSLARYRRRRQEDFPRHAGYLSGCPERQERWRARLQELPPGPKIGISWRGGTAITNTSGRSLTLQQLRPILATKNTHFVNLQYGEAVEEIAAFSAETGIAIHHWPDALDDCDETAALVCSLDLVISVCTSVVHLTGALGRPAWVMAPHVSEWRYGHEGASMIWYPSVKMFRQPKPEAWPAVIAEVKRSLLKLPTELT